MTGGAIGKRKREPVEHVDPERLLSESHDVIIREIAPFMRRGAYKLQARAIELGLPMPQQVQTLRAGARRASLILWSVRHRI